MKTKLMIILTMSSIMLTYVGCKPNDDDEEQINQNTVDEAIITLTSNDWESIDVALDGTTDTTVKRKLHFTNRAVTLSSEYMKQGASTFSKDEGEYEMSKDGKTISITIKEKVYTLNYSKVNLTGLWDKKYLKFKLILPSTEQIPWDGTAVMWTKGIGTITSPYRIETAKQLAYLAQETNKGTNYVGIYFRLINNLNLGGYSKLKWVPIGTNKSYPFSGNFDGNGKTIADMYVDAAFNDYAGLFGYVTRGEIKSIGIVGGSSVTAIRSCAGGIVGYSESPIINCYNTGNVQSSSEGYTGGIVGYSKSPIINCYNTGNVSGSIEYSSSLNSYVGGIAGGCYDIIKNCYNTGNVSSSVSQISESTAYAGGISGDGLNFENCYNVGTVNAYGPTCRASGINGGRSYANAHNCYTLTNMVSINNAQRTNGNNKYGIVKTSWEMRNSSFVALLNNSQAPTGWLMDKTPNTNQGYPILLSHEIFY